MALRQTLDGITSADTNMLATGSGKLATVGDVTYQDPDSPTAPPKVIKSSERQTAAVRQFSEVVSPAIAKANNETPEQTFNRELNVYANGGAENPKWKALLEAAPLAASANELTDPKKRDQLLAAAQLYDQLREKNPLYLQQLVSSKTQDFFDTYRVAKGMPSPSGQGSATMEEAIGLASRATATGKDADDILKGHYRTIEQKVLNADPSSFLSRWLPQFMGGDANPVNTGYLQQQITEKAKLFARLGLPPDEAITQATEAVKGSTTKVNGWIVPKLGTNVPADFPQKAAEYLKAFAEQNGKLNDGVSANDVGLVYDGAGTFTIVGRNGVGLRTPAGIARFTLRDLADYGTNADAQTPDRLLTGSNVKRSGITPDLRHVKDPETRRSLADYYGGGPGSPRTQVYDGFTLDGQPIAPASKSAPKDEQAQLRRVGYGNIPATDDRGEDQLAKFKEWNPDPIGNHARLLASVKPDLQSVIRRAQEIAGISFVVGSGTRDDKQQAKARKFGWSGTDDSKHLHGDAVDLWVLDKDQQVTFKDEAAYARVSKAMSQAASELGFEVRWGGSFKKRDIPHFELVGRKAISHTDEVTAVGRAVRNLGQ